MGRLTIHSDSVPMIGLRHRLRRSIAKTAPDFVGLVLARAPKFVYGGKLDTIPVFTYHRVDASFEQDLIALLQGGYRTVGSAQLQEFASGGGKPRERAVALTFDDGHISLTEIAAPLLAAHGFVGIAFVVSGLVPPRSSGELAGWDELRHWVRLGVLEVGAHSLYHNHVPVRPQVIGFVTPSTALGFTADIPVPRLGGSDSLPLGHPILRGGPRYTVRRAFHPTRDGLARGPELIESEGAAFFSRPDWDHRLRRAVRIGGRYESFEEADRAVTDDMRESMRLISQHCPNPAERHFCYPWYALDRRTNRLARLVGADLVYGGVTTASRRGEADSPPSLQRLPPDFLWRLPGPRRLHLGTLLARRVVRAVHGSAFRDIVRSEP